MAFNNNINFVEAQGQLGSTAPGTDYISSMVFKTATTPSGFTWSVAQEIFSLVQAQNLGIVGGFADETAAKSLVTVSATGSIGNTINITVVEPDINSTFNSVNIGTYTVQSIDTTTQTLATNLSNFINAGTSGYSATTPVGGSFSLVAVTGLGTTINSTSPTVTTTAGTTVTAAAFSGGVNSVRMSEWYQISEFFRMNPTGVLWVDYEQTYGQYKCLSLIQSQAGNYINQFALFNSGATTSAGITTDTAAINSVCNTLFQPGYAPAVVVYAPNLYNFSNLALAPNLSTLNEQYVEVLLEQDGGGLGAWLSFMYGTSCPAYGNVLGLFSSANVSADIGCPGLFNQANGFAYTIGTTTYGQELAVPAFSNGQLYSYLAATQFNLLVQLDSFRYVFGRTIANLTGTFVQDDHNCTNLSSDYNYIDRVRVINKVARTVYGALAPLINSQVLANSNGTISAQAIAIFQAAARPGLNAMITQGNISAYPVTVGSNVNNIYLPPTQNVVSSSIVQVVVNIVPIGIAREITVTLGFVI